MGCKEDDVTLQADGDHDHKCTSPRNIMSLTMMMIKLNLQHLIVMKNAGGYSSHNPIERAMGSIAFGSQCLALDRLEGLKDVEEKLKECKSIKTFIDKHGDDERLKSGHMRTLQPYIDEVNDAIRNVEHAKKKIKIGTIAEPQVTKECVDDLREVCE